MHPFNVNPTANRASTSLKPKRLAQAIRLSLALSVGFAAVPAYATLTCPVTSLQTVTGAVTLSTDCGVASTGTVQVNNAGSLTSNAALNNQGTVTNQVGGILTNNRGLVNSLGANLKTRVS